MQKLNELVPVNPGNIGGVTVSLVSAKKLHEFLGVGRDFTTWIKGVSASMVLLLAWILLWLKI